MQAAASIGRAGVALECWQAHTASAAMLWISEEQSTGRQLLKHKSADDPNPRTNNPNFL